MVVTATRVNQPLSEAASSITVVSEKEIAQTQPLTFAEILDTIPNVDTTSSTSVMYNRVSIRGSQPNQITYLIDGMRQDDLTMGGIGARLGGGTRLRQHRQSFRHRERLQRLRGRDGQRTLPVGPLPEGHHGQPGNDEDRKGPT